MIDILFVLPVGGGSGGAHSVMQEADAMRAMGVRAAIAANAENAARLRRGYRDLPGISAHVFGYRGADGLSDLITQRAPGVVVATTNQSVHVLAAAMRHGGHKSLRTAYYIQDYEPLFYARDSTEWTAAYTSYGLIPGMLHFAKTRWLQETVESNHRIQVAKVEPSIDHRIYHPQLDERGGGGSDGGTGSERLHIAAMVRPGTPRRAPRRTVRILSRLAHELGDRVQVTAFGCTSDELKVHALRLSRVEHLGVLSREGVGDLFRHTDLFLDLSDFQAFGRTALEAMSCGCTAVVPAHGGAYEFAEDGRNAFIVDVRSDDAILAATRDFAAMSAPERHAMMLAGIEAGYRYSPERAALSEIRILLQEPSS